MRRALLLLLLLAPAARAATSRVLWSLPDSATPPASLEARLDELASACERGDRAALVALLTPARRAEAQGLADELLSSTSAPLTGVRVEVTALPRAPQPGSLLLLATTTPAPLSDLPPVPDGFTRAQPGTAARSLTFTDDADGLDLREGAGSAVVNAAIDVTLDAKPPRAHSTCTFDLDGKPRVALFEVGAGASVKSLNPDVVLVPIENGGSGMGAIRAEWTGVRRGSLAIESDVPVPQQDIRGGAIVALNQSQLIPFAGLAHFRYELTMDVPLPNRSVSVGEWKGLPASAGRRKTKWTCDRAVDYLPLAAGPFTIDSQGEGAEKLELWRTHEVGGDAPAILKELRELVDYQEKNVAPLPYRAFRLVELPTVDGLAVSYASMIFMAPDMMAQREFRAEILSHEIGHQWWGNAVSPDPTARWAAEGMADAMKDLFVRQRFGDERWLDRQDKHRSQYLASLSGKSRPLGANPGGGDVYDRGALFVHALHAELGDATFWKVLRRWFDALGPGRPLTSDFRREAESVAGRSLGSVFDPWLGSTALPVVRMTTSTEPKDDGVVVHVALTQDTPAFPLDVPIRASTGDRVETWTMRLDSAEVRGDHDVPFVPDAVDLDPGHLLPRVLDDELDAYERHEASACLARGDAARAKALLLDLSKRSMLQADASVELFAARVLSGDPVETAKRDLDVVVEEQADPARRQVAMMTAADALLDQGAPAAALPIFQALDAELTVGASAPLRVGLALRALGRESEAQAALKRAFERDPTDARTRAALGLPATGGGSEPGEIAWTPLLPADEALLKGSSSDGTIALALGAGRYAVLLAGSRAVLCGKPGAMTRVAGFAPSGAIGMIVVDPHAAHPQVAVLESARQRSKMTIVQVGKDGSGTVVAKHERLPGGALTIVSGTEGGPLIAYHGSGTDWDWRRFVAPLGASSAGPDDEDGLKTIAPADDPRLPLARTTPEPEQGATGSLGVELDGLGLVTILDTGRRLASAAERTPAWDALDSTDRVASARGFGEGIALVLRTQRPATEDAPAPPPRLFVVAGEIVRDVALPQGALDASLAPDGTLAVEVEPRDPTMPRLLAGRLSLDAAATSH